MAAVWARARSGLRGRVRTMVVLVLIVGIAGGAALTAVAGARRTDSAMSRFLAYARSTDVFVGSDDPSLYPRIGGLPQVESWEIGAYMLMRPLQALTPGSTDGGGAFVIVRDPGSYRPLMLAGRMPRPDRVDEVLINASAAAGTHLGVGSTVRMRGWLPSDADAVLRGTPVPARGPVVTATVVGIGRFPSEISTAPPTPGVIYTGTSFFFFTPAFFRAYGDKIAIAGGLAMSARLKGGAAAFPAFRTAVKRISPDARVEYGSDDLTAASKVHHATGLEALALLLFGIVAALFAAALVSQAMARQAFVDATDFPSLGAMGMTRRQLAGAGAIRAATIGAVGAGLALATAYLLSPRMPIGVARQAEIAPGYSFDGLVLPVGTAAIFGFITAAGALASWRMARAPRVAAAGGGARRSSRLADRLAGAGLPPSTVVGARMALEPGRGATAVPVRSALVTAVVAVAVLVGTLGFGASLGRLADQPRLQGWNWDVSVGNPHSHDLSAIAKPKLRADRDVAGFSGLAGPVDALAGGRGGAPGGLPAGGGLFALDPAQGSVLPAFIAGRAPATADEIALGAKDLSAIGRRVGDRIPVTAGGPPRTMRIVGEMVLTPAVLNEQVDLGHGALVNPAGFRALGADAPETVFLVRFRPGVDRTAAMRRLQRDFPGTVLTAVRPADVENLRRVDGLPSLLAALVAAVALLTVGHMLVTSVRRRRHDLAILRSMGFVRRQVSGAVAWQATILATVGLLVGVPAGVIAGRWLWAWVATQLGVPSLPVVPLPAIVAVAAGAVAVANAVAWLPGVLAARTGPARILRTE